MTNWLEEEMAACNLGDKRLDKRQAVLLERVADQPSLSIPAACKGLAETIGAYRFFDNERLTPRKILSPHVEATLKRLRDCELVLLVQDTTEMDFTGKNDIKGLGPLNWAERIGLFNHALLAFTPEGLCLGVVDAHMWTREPEGEPQGHLRKQKPIEHKESYRWIQGYRKGCEVARLAPQSTVISVADREGDIYELFVEAELAAQQGNSAEWIVRACRDRSLPSREHGHCHRYKKLWATLRQAPVLGRRHCKLPRAEQREARQATLSIRAKRVLLKAPFRKGAKLPNLQVSAILATEADPPEGEKPVQWLLLSSLAVESLEQACMIIDYYLVRWQVEMYFKVLKGTCKVETLQLQSVDRLKRCIALKMIAAWRTLFVTHLSRCRPDAPCTVAFEEQEWKSVHMVSRGGPLPEAPPRLAEFVKTVAALGGYLGRKCDGPPGPIRLCVGLQRMHHYAQAWIAFGPKHHRRCV